MIATCSIFGRARGATAASRLSGRRRPSTVWSQPLQALPSARNPADGRVRGPAWAIRRVPARRCAMTARRCRRGHVVPDVPSSLSATSARPAVLWSDTRNTDERWTVGAASAVDHAAGVSRRRGGGRLDPGSRESNVGQEARSAAPAHIPDDPETRGRVDDPIQRRAIRLHGTTSTARKGRSLISDEPHAGAVIGASVDSRGPRQERTTRKRHSRAATRRRAPAAPSSVHSLSGSWGVAGCSAGRSRSARGHARLVGAPASKLRCSRGPQAGAAPFPSEGQFFSGHVPMWNRRGRWRGASGTGGGAAIAARP